MVGYGEVVRAIELPYITEGVALVGRVVPVVPYYSQEEADWHAFLDIPGKGLVRMQMRGVVSGVLLAAEPLLPEEDLCVPLANLIFQRLSFPQLVRRLDGLFDVVENLASLLELYAIVSQRYANHEAGAEQLAQSLVNSLMVTCRTQYEVLHGIGRIACSMVRCPDNLSKHLVQDLPKRVSQVMLHNGVPRTAEALRAEYGMPTALADWYSRQAPLLALIRAARNKLVHRGLNVGRPSYVFCLDQGLAVSADVEPWRGLDVWNNAALARNGLGSLRKVFAFLVSSAMDAAAQFATSYGTCISLPEPISPRNTLFFRSPLNRHLMDLGEILASPWERAGSDD